MTITADDMDFTVFCIFDHPAAAVFEAVADPARLSQHFTMGGASGRMQAGATVTWEFADFPGAFDVNVIEARPAERLVFDWPDHHGTGMNRVTFAFDEFAPGRTRVEVTESGWQPTRRPAIRLRKRDGLDLYAGGHARLAGSRHRHPAGDVPLTRQPIPKGSRRSRARRASARALSTDIAPQLRQ